MSTMTGFSLTYKRRRFSYKNWFCFCTNKVKDPYTDFWAEYTGLHNPVSTKKRKKEIALPAYKVISQFQGLEACNYSFSEAGLNIIH